MYETSRVFHELLDVLRDADQQFLAGPRAVGDEAFVVEGYRFLTEVLTVALDCYVHADPLRPEFVEIVTPTRKFGGDNADAFYYFAPVDPTRSYRITCERGDAVYLSLCCYGGPTDGRWSDRIVGTLNDREVAPEPDGSFVILASPNPQAKNWLRLDSDAVAFVTRDYQADARHGRRARWAIACLDGPTTPPPPLSDAEGARRFRATANFIRDLLNVCPIPLPFPANEIQPPYKQPLVTYGWAAPDAAYAMGRYDLADDEALVIEGRSPGCAFWNLVLWNPFLQTFDYRHHRCTINGTQVHYEADGSWRIVVSACDPGHPNWVATAGHPRGVIWFRWFLADAVPEQPQTRVVKRTRLT
jgi:hypothetical protein